MSKSKQASPKPRDGKRLRWAKNEVKKFYDNATVFDGMAQAEAAALDLAVNRAILLHRYQKAAALIAAAKLSR